MSFQALTSAQHAFESVKSTSFHTRDSIDEWLNSLPGSPEDFEPIPDDLIVDVELEAEAEQDADADSDDSWDEWDPLEDAPLVLPPARPARKQRPLHLLPEYSALLKLESSLFERNRLLYRRAAQQKGVDPETMLLNAGYCDTAAASVRKRSPSPAILKRRQSERILASAAVERGRSSERKTVGSQRARSPSPQPQARPQQRRVAGNWSATTSSSSAQLPGSSPWLQRQSMATLPLSSESGNQGSSRPLQRESTVLFPTSDDAPRPAPAASSRSLRRRAAFVFSDEEGDALFGHGPATQAGTSTQPAALEAKAPNPFMVVFNQLVAVGKRKREPDANADADVDNTSPTKRRRTTQDTVTVARNASLGRASTPALVVQSQPQPSLLTRVKRPMAGAARIARSLFGKSSSSAPQSMGPAAVLVCQATDGAVVS